MTNTILGEDRMLIVVEEYSVTDQVALSLAIRMDDEWQDDPNKLEELRRVISLLESNGQFAKMLSESVTLIVNLTEVTKQILTESTIEFCEKL